MINKRNCKELSGGLLNPCELCNLAFSPLCEDGKFLPFPIIRDDNESMAG